MKISVPTGWEDVTVLEFQQMALLDVDSNPSVRLRDIISILCGIDSNDLDMASVREIEQQLTFLNTQMPQARLSEFKHDNVNYKWIKSLNEITLGEQISIEQTIEQGELNFYESFDLVMAVLLQKEDEVFKAENISKLRDEYGSMPIVKVHAMILFFLSGGLLSSKLTRAFLVVPKVKRNKDGVQKKLSLTKRLPKRALQTVLNGWQWSIDLQKMILQSMSKYSK